MVVREDVLLSDYTTLAVGGPARYFVEASNEDDVARAVELSSRHTLPLFVMGGGSNLLVSDAGYPGIVLRMATRGIVPAEMAGGGGAATESFQVEAGEDWDTFVAHCVDRGLGGVECLSGIPGSVGGTPVQNVGAYGQEVSTVISRVRAYDRTSGRMVEIDNADCGFSYRTSRFNTTSRDQFIIQSVDFKLVKGQAANIQYRDVARYFEGKPSLPTLAEVRQVVRAIRRQKAMLIVPGDPDCRSAGSFFKNPVVEETTYLRIEATAGPGVPKFPAAAGSVKIPAAWLIEKSGFHRGHARGGAAISSRHTLALTNRAGATARDILELAREIRDGVRARFGIELRPEPVFLGFEEEF